jgi:hypothetical protein
MDALAMFFVATGGIFAAVIGGLTLLTWLEMTLSRDFADPREASAAGWTAMSGRGGRRPADATRPSSADPTPSTGSSKGRPASLR